MLPGECMSTEIETTQPSSLWRNPDFLKLWSAETISAIGSKISFLALPMTAVTVLHATPAQMGLLTALGSLPALLLGLFIGVWVDRRRRRALLVLADVGRGILLALIPLAALGGMLQLPLLYAIIFATGAFNLLFGTAYPAYLPSLLPRSQLVDANSKFALSHSAAEIAGPGLAGGLIQWLSAPIAILFDALSFLGSGLLIGWIRTPEPAPQPEPNNNLWRELGAGFHLLAKNSTLRSLTACTSTISFFNAALEAVFLLYMTEQLGLEPALIGLIFAAGSIGFMVGALLPNRLAQRLGLGPMMIGGLILLALADLALPLVAGPKLLIVAVLVVAQIGFGLGLTLYQVGQTSLRQTLTPDELLGRVTATLAFAVSALVPLGALLGGLLGELIGLRPTLLLAATGELLAVAWLLGSPLRNTHGPAVDG